MQACNVFITLSALSVDSDANRTWFESNWFFGSIPIFKMVLSWESITSLEQMLVNFRWKTMKCIGRCPWILKFDVRNTKKSFELYVKAQTWRALNFELKSNLSMYCIPFLFNTENALYHCFCKQQSFVFISIQYNITMMLRYHTVRLIRL